MLHLGDQRFETPDEICVRFATLSRCGQPREHNLVLTSRLPPAVAIFDVIAGCDPADPVIAASQGKWAGSYLRFRDKDGAHGARLGVVHQLFTSEDADPGAMARALVRNVSGSRRQGASGRCRFGERDVRQHPRERARCAEDRDRGTPRGATPPPPPGIRVRTTAVRPG